MCSITARSSGVPRITTARRPGARKVLWWDVHPAARHVRAVLAVAAAVHVEAVAEAAPHLDVVARLVPRAAAPRAGDGVTVGVEEVALDEGPGAVVADAVPETLVLVVVDEAVLHAVAVTACEIDGAVAPAGQLAVVDAQPGFLRLNAVGGGELIVVAVSAVAPHGRRGSDAPGTGAGLAPGGADR